MELNAKYKNISRCSDICQDVYESISFFNLIGRKSWIAGGSVKDLLNGKRPNDIDVFFTDSDAYRLLLTQLERHSSFKVIGANNNTLKVEVRGQKIDLVKIYFNTPEDCLKSFDFTICCAALTESWLCHHESYFQHLAARKLFLNRLPNNVQIIERLQKYIKKGFTISRDEMVELVRTLVKNSNNNNFYLFNELFSGASAEDCIHTVNESFTDKTGSIDTFKQTDFDNLDVPF